MAHYFYLLFYFFASVSFVLPTTDFNVYLLKMAAPRHISFLLSLSFFRALKSLQSNLMSLILVSILSIACHPLGICRIVFKTFNFL
mmetsp:Transcript_80542/g.130565  ORF Transcript_80542/g.130565 Transcript_80542/m.130565 type:complete len:86 (+) Transcript_80542:71-328(+)